MYVCLCICEHMSQGDQGTALSFHHVFLGMKPRSLGFVASIFTYCDSLVPLMWCFDASLGSVEINIFLFKKNKMFHYVIQTMGSNEQSPAPASWCGCNRCIWKKIILFFFCDNISFLSLIFYKYDLQNITSGMRKPLQQHWACTRLAHWHKLARSLWNPIHS